MSKEKADLQQVLNLFLRYVSYLRNTDRLLRISLGSIGAYDKYLDLVKALDKLEKIDLEQADNGEKVSRIEEDVEFTREEAIKGFPTLHAQSTVVSWAALETLIEDVSISWLLTFPSTLTNEVFSKVKVPLAQYESQSREERMNFLLKEVIRQKNADLKIGINRFETVLECLGLSGPVEPDIKDAIFEFSQVRNLIVHRTCVVDYRFKASCPWIDVPVGETLDITGGMYQRYNAASMTYAKNIVDRIKTYEDPS